MRASLKQSSRRSHRSRRPGRTGLSGLTLAGLLGLAAGCGREEIRVYEAPKDSPAAAAAAQSLPDLGQPAAAARPQLTWKLPPGWQERPATAIRVGHFVVAGPDHQEAEVTVIPLAGTGGSDLDNVNRWRAQVNLPAVNAEQLSRLAVSVPIGGFEGRLFDLVGDSYEANDQRTLAAVLRREGTAWFFKMTGPAKLVGDQKGAFLEFLRALQFGGANAGASAGTAATAASPAPAAAAAAAATPTAPGDAGLPRWQVPEHWQAQSPGAMQAARFAPRDAAGRAEISVAMLPGDGGGRLANVNRWRRQLGLGPISEADLAAAAQPLPAGGAAGYWVDIPAPESGRRMVAAAVQVGDRSWFYKLTGEAAVVEREKPVFLQFVQTAAYAP